jgi:hypothetical protein
MRRILNKAAGGIEYRQTIVKVLPNFSENAPRFGGIANFLA